MALFLVHIYIYRVGVYSIWPNQELVSSSLSKQISKDILYIYNIYHLCSFIVISIHHPSYLYIAVSMVERVYETLPLNGILPGLIYLQNLPSMVVSHVLNPQPGETILDMCASPGINTTTTIPIVSIL